MLSIGSSFTGIYSGVSSFLVSLGPRRCVWLWVVCVVAVIGVYSASLTLTKHIWQDEVQILEAGRVALPHADRSYSMIWKLDAESPLQLSYYLGPVLQDTFCDLFGPHTPAGPRIFSLMGAVLGSGALLGWLLSRGSVPWIALACSLLFFLDPLFVESYRGARVDSWSMALMLLALWAIVSGRKKPPGRWGFATWEIFAGIAMAFAAVLWVSAVLLVPLVVLESLRNDSSAYRSPLTTRAAGLMWLGFFAALSLILLLLPVLTSLSNMLGDSSGLAGSRLRAGINLAGFLTSYIRSPWLPICAVSSILISRNWFLAAATVVAVGGVLITGAYTHRIIYLLPYLLVAVAAGASFLWTKASGGVFAKAVALSALLNMLVWSVAVSVGARTFVALSERQVRDPSKLLAMLKESVGAGPYRAYISPFELYYATRALGWKTYRTDKQISDWSDPQLRGLLANMSVVIQRGDDPNSPPEDLMKSLGFSSRKVSTGLGPAKKMENYGEYIIYKR